MELFLLAFVIFISWLIISIFVAIIKAIFCR